MDYSKRIAVADTVFSQRVDDEIVLLDMESENYFGLDSVATDIWQLLQDGKTFQETVDALRNMYEVDQDVLKKDLETFVETLINKKLAKIA
ncbi:PqqD family protein [Sulfurimonas sp. HSL-1656]|uniref:PqqD family protein n=1 Tax=Thiomicrolovo subterrani TaxID=3131934 RepID=UPI0031F8AD9E